MALERKWGATGPAQEPATIKGHWCVLNGVAAQRAVSPPRGMVRDNQTPRTVFVITSTESPYPNLLSPIDVGPMTLPNRVIMGSMHTLIKQLDRPVDRPRRQTVQQRT